MKYKINIALVGILFPLIIFGQTQNTGPSPNVLVGGGGGGAATPDTATFRVLNFSNLNSSFGEVGNIAFIQRTGAVIRRTATGWNEVVSVEDGRKVTNPQTATVNTYTPGITYAKASIATASDVFNFANPTSAISNEGVYLFQVTNSDGTPDVVSFGTNYVGPDGAAISDVTIPANQTATFEFQVGTLGANTILRQVNSVGTSSSFNPTPINGIDERDTVVVEFDNQFYAHPGVQFASGFEWDISTNSNSNPYMVITNNAANELPDTEEDGAIRVVNNQSNADLLLNQATGNVNGGATYTLPDERTGLFRYDSVNDDWLLVELSLNGESNSFDLSDADGDTRVEVEQNPDEDIIRLTIAGVEVGNFSATRLDFINRRVQQSGSGALNSTSAAQYTIVNTSALQAAQTIVTDNGDYEVYTDGTSSPQFTLHNEGGVTLDIVTTSERNGISVPAAGMIVYNSDNNQYEFYNNTDWKPVANNTGYIDYNDTTGIVAISANTWTDVPNNGAGAFSNSTYKPVGVTELLDTSTGYLDFSDLTLGSELNIRNDFIVNPSTNNCLLEVRYLLGQSPNEYALLFWSERLDNGSGIDYQRVIPFPIYMGDANTQGGVGKLQIRLSSAGTLNNNGSYISATVR